MTDTEKIQAERNELNKLINKGVSFDVECVVYKQQKGVFGRLKKRIATTETLKYSIQEPTLSTLDRLSVEQIELHIDEKVMSSEKGIQQAKIMTNVHGKRMARIIAIAVLGTDYKDQKKLKHLTELFFENIKPSKLIQLVLLINTMSNYADFTNSIRLMSAARTTMPILIEGSNED
jgi:hypothetical protein